MCSLKLSIYAATQGMRAYNNNDICNSFGLRMLLWLHALIHCVAAYMFEAFRYKIWLMLVVLGHLKKKEMEKSGF